MHPPEINCPGDIVGYTVDSLPRNINWTKPSCHDNSGEQCYVKLISPSTLGLVHVGTTAFIYEAKDNWNNTKECSFNVTLKGMLHKLCEHNESIYN